MFQSGLDRRYAVSDQNVNFNSMETKYTDSPRERGGREVDEINNAFLGNRMKHGSKCHVQGLMYDSPFKVCCEGTGEWITLT